MRRPLLVYLLFLCSTPSAAMSPPWQQLAQRVKATLGADPCVEVGDIENSAEGGATLVIPIHVCDQGKADALSTLIADEIDFINARVSLQFSVQGPERVGEPLAAMDQRAVLMQALSDNPYFLEVSTSQVPNTLWVVFKKLVIQYYADNLADAFFQNNEVAEAAFASLFDFSHFGPYRVRTSTEKKP